MKKYIYITESYQGEELSASSLYGLGGLRSLILHRSRYSFDGQLVYRYVDGVIDSHWMRCVRACADGVSFQHL